MRAGMVVELDGGQHRESEQLEYDRIRTRKLSDLGIKVVRFADDEVLEFSEAVKQTLYNDIRSNRPSPQPSPGAPGEGEEGAGTST